MKILFKVLATLIISVPLIAQTTYAESSGTLPFSITPEIESNQKKHVTGYFDLDVIPNQTYNLKVNITNLRNKKVHLIAKPTNALSSPSGGIQYIEKDNTPDSTLSDTTYAIKENIDITETITLKARETKSIPFKVTIPKGATGVLLGGLNFVEKNPSSEDEIDTNNKDVSFVIKNKVAFTMAIKLNTNQPEETKVSFTDTSIEVIPAGPLLKIGINNHNATITEDIKGTFRVFDSANEEVFNGKFGSFKMAPKSSIKYPVFWRSDTFTPGDYTIVVKGEHKGEEISFENDFKIKNNTVKTYYEQTGYTPPKPMFFSMPWWGWGLIGVGSILFIFIGIRFGVKKAERRMEDILNYKEVDNDNE